MMKYKMVLLGILLAPIFMNSQNNNSLNKQNKTFNYNNTIIINKHIQI